jgi:regulator of sigma E protease
MSTIIDLLTVILGFSLIIVIHELGHFFAAKWAGVRVLAFAVGFGPALLSYRKGMGVAMGSTEPRFRRLARDQGDGRGIVPGISSTEYRLNMLPLGGYVKMLGQDDADPSHRSEQPDSYTAVSIPKRMVIISAGVIMNLITAALMFIVVFMIGLKTESARIGFVAKDSPAANATAVIAVSPPLTQTTAPDASSNSSASPAVAGAAPATPPAAPRSPILAGDVITEINGTRIEAFKDITLAVAMAAPDTPMRITLQRDGVPMIVQATPKIEPSTKMLALGIGPALTGTLEKPSDPNAAARAGELLAGLSGNAELRPGASLLAGETFAQLDARVQAAGGQPVIAQFLNPGATTPIDVTLQPVPELQEATIASVDGVQSAFGHLLGLVPLMTVETVEEAGKLAGLQGGDVFARIGDATWPSFAAGISQIRAPGRTKIDLTVLRVVDGQVTRVELKDVPVRDQRIGFRPNTTAASELPAAFGGVPITRWPTLARPGGATSPTTDAPPAANLGMFSGSIITHVGDVPVSSWRQMHIAITRAAQNAPADAQTTTIELRLRIPDGGRDGLGTEERVKLTLSTDDRTALAALGWTSPLGPELFTTDEFLLKRSSPIAAVAKGINETHKMVLTTYLTFARLFQGTVKVEHLKGPVGIAHVGTIIAERGWIWVLFFMAALSVNLAVVNFLPLPIVDGGHFVFLCWEAITGKPVSVAVQNVATIAGLVLIGSLFLVVTFNDVVRLLT